MTIETQYPINYIKEIVAIAKEAGLQSLKLEGLEVQFGRIEAPTEQVMASSAPHQIQEVPEPSNMPPDLKGDDLFNFDKVLHWSGSGENDTQPLPLTGEEAL